MHDYDEMVIVELHADNFKYEFDFSADVRCENANIVFDVKDTTIRVEFERVCGRRFINIYKNGYFSNEIPVDGLSFSWSKNNKYLVEALIHSTDNHACFYIRVYENPEKNHDYVLKVYVS